MTETQKRVMIALACWALMSTGWSVYFLKRMVKAETCNRAFVLWFHHNLGININLDKLYEDAKKWVYDPQYQ